MTVPHERTPRRRIVLATHIALACTAGLGVLPGTLPQAAAAQAPAHTAAAVRPVADATDAAALANILRALDAPFADALQTTLVDQFSTADKIAQARAKIEAATDAELTLDGAKLDRATCLKKLDDIAAKRTYLADNADAIASSVIELSHVGSRGTDWNRTKQYFNFDNADYTGFFIRPGIKAKFRIYVESDGPVLMSWAHRQAGRVDTNNYAVARADDGGTLKAGVNEITFDTTARSVGQVLYIRNDTFNAARVRIEGADADAAHPVTGTSLGRYPYYRYDAAHPERFWTYLTELRAYVKAGVDTKVGEIKDNPKLSMDITGLVLGRAMFDVRAAKAVDAFKDIQSEADAVAYIKHAYEIAEGRLEFFDHVQGFDANDTDTRQLPTKLYIVSELTQNLTNPSSMFAWYTMYHMPEDIFPGVITDLNTSHGWGNDHEFGHMLDIQPLTRVEETNNLFSIWGRRRAALAEMQASGKPFTTAGYHGGVLSANTMYKAWLNDKLAGKNPASRWDDIWWGVTVRFTFLRFFDDYDYSHYDYSSGSFTPEMAAQVNRYGGLGAVYRQVRRDPARYTNAGGIYDAAVRAYSDALGFDMAEALGRVGLGDKISDATRAYAAKYPRVPERVEFYTIDSDAAGIIGAKPYSAMAPAPTTNARRNADGSLTITASYAPGTAEAKTTTGYVLLEDGHEVAYAADGVFTVAKTKEMPRYTVVAYDYRTNPSPVATVRTETDVDVRVAVVGGDKKPTDAKIRIKSDDPRVAERTVPVTGATTTLKDVGPATISVELAGYTAYPGKAYVDSIAWKGGTLQFTLVAQDAQATARTPRPLVTAGADGDGTLVFSITDAAADAGGSDIYYTLDGSEPTTENGMRWRGGTVGITSSPLTIKVRAYQAGKLPSEIASATFTDDRTITIWDEVWGPDYGVGNRQSFGVGEFRGAEQLGKIYNNVKSIKIPSGIKVTLYEGENLDGTAHVFTGTEQWVDKANPYNAFPIKSLKVETVKAPAATAAGTLTFKAGAADATGTMASMPLYKGVAVTVPDVTFTRRGWVATGWTRTDTGTGAGRAGGAAAGTVVPGDVITPTGADVTLTATWRRARYQVVFDAAGGTGSVTALEAEVGSDVTLPSAGFARTGYTFAGWELPDGSTAAAGGTVESLGEDEGDVEVVHARWQANRYTVRFAAGADDVSGTMTDQAFVYDAAEKLDKSAFARAGYDFAGWVDEAGTHYADAAEVKNLTDADGGVVTLTAQWTRHETPGGGGNPGGGSGGTGGSGGEAEGGNPGGSTGNGGTGTGGGAVAPDVPPVDTGAAGKKPASASGSTAKATRQLSATEGLLAATGDTQFIVGSIVVQLAALFTTLGLALRKK